MAGLHPTQFLKFFFVRFFGLRTIICSLGTSLHLLIRIRQTHREGVSRYMIDSIENRYSPHLIRKDPAPIWYEYPISLHRWGHLSACIMTCRGIHPLYLRSIHLRNYSWEEEPPHLIHKIQRINKLRFCIYRDRQNAQPDHQPSLNALKPWIIRWHRDPSPSLELP